MEIVQLKRIFESDKNKKLIRLYDFFQKLTDELNSKDIPDSSKQFVNNELEALNSLEANDKVRIKNLRASKNTILKHLEIELKLLAKNHYTLQWMVLGLALFGVPLGTTFGAALKNMGLLGIGIPIGMVIGMAIGAEKDKQVLKEGRQLDFEK